MFSSRLMQPMLCRITRPVGSWVPPKVIVWSASTITFTKRKWCVSVSSQFKTLFPLTIVAAAGFSSIFATISVVLAQKFLGILHLETFVFNTNCGILGDLKVKATQWSNWFAGAFASLTRQFIVFHQRATVKLGTASSEWVVIKWRAVHWYALPHGAFIDSLIPIGACYQATNFPAVYPFPLLSLEWVTVVLFGQLRGSFLMQCPRSLCKIEN